MERGVQAFVVPPEGGDAIGSPVGGTTRIVARTRQTAGSFA